MGKDNANYDKIISALRNSKPVFYDADEITEKVIRQIRSEKIKISFQDLIMDFFFGWVYIGWIRKSMVAAAMVILVFFGYQQTVILNRISELPTQNNLNEIPVMTNLKDEFSNGMMKYKYNGKNISEKGITISDKEIEQLIKSLNKLQLKYKDLFYLIENDPELKNYVEEKMNENRKN